jgi:hypothetical protein
MAYEQRNNILKIPEFKPPSLEAFSEEALECFLECDAMRTKLRIDLSLISKLRKEAWRQNSVVSEQFLSLRTKHSDKYLDINANLKFDWNRTSGEIEVKKSIEGVHDIYLSASPEKLFRIKGLSNLELRTGNIFSSGDLTGYRVIYPNAYNASRCFEFNRHLVDKFYSISPSLTATAVLCSIFTCHPLKDGNGRLGRILFNHIFSSNKNTDFYLPLYDIAAVSAGGWLYSLRHVQLDNNWTPIANFIKSASGLFKEN